MNKYGLTLTRLMSAADAVIIIFIGVHNLHIK